MSATEVQVVEERIFDIVFKEDDLTWKEMIYDLVRLENINPWDVNISILAEKFLKMLKELKETNFRVSGKVILAASLLLKLKSDRLVGEDLANFEKLLTEPVIEEMFDEDDNSYEFQQTSLQKYLNDEKKLIPRTPQPRERKVSVFDLVNALEKALDSDIVKQRRRILNGIEVENIPKTPEKYFDLGEIMSKLHKHISKLFISPTTKVYFTDLLTEDNKECKVYTFLPLLHLENQKKLEMNQKEHFGEIEVKILNRNFE